MRLTAETRTRWLADRVALLLDIDGIEADIWARVERHDDDDLADLQQRIDDVRDVVLTQLRAALLAWDRREILH